MMFDLYDDSRWSDQCGRLDKHTPHTWRGIHGEHQCPGVQLTEGAHPCAECQRPVATCRCDYWREQERGEEWSS